MLFWVDHGIIVFRVDNPHTKPLPFWEWMIRTVRADHPEVVFLAEAFTHRAMMQTLAKVGFNQSYTYFTWKQASWELTEYLTELAHGEERDYFRPNFFVNTPDILTAELAEGGPAKFVSRLVLAATLSPGYGIYSGYEHFERTPVVPGFEEYLDSEKYEAKQRSLDGPLLPTHVDVPPEPGGRWSVRREPSVAAGVRPRGPSWSTSVAVRCGWRTERRPYSERTSHPSG